MKDLIKAEVEDAFAPFRPKGLGVHVPSPPKALNLIGGALGQLLAAEQETSFNRSKFHRVSHEQVLLSLKGAATTITKIRVLGEKAGDNVDQMPQPVREALDKFSNDIIEALQVSAKSLEVQANSVSMDGPTQSIIAQKTGAPHWRIGSTRP